MDEGLYEVSNFKQYLKPIKVYVEGKEEEGEEREEEEEKNKGVNVDDLEMIQKLEEQGEYYGVYYYMLIIMAIVLYLLFIQYEYLIFQVDSNYQLLCALFLCQVLDSLLRLCLCCLLLLFSLCTRPAVPFQQTLLQVQIYEVFEEHIKLGIVCLDVNYQEEEKQLGDYSLISNRLTNVEEEKEKREEHWFIKTIKKVKKTVVDKLERAHLPELEYDRKH